jgi:hypothetical protein
MSSTVPLGCDDTAVRPIRFRYNSALAVAGVIAVIGGLPLLKASLWFAPILLIPLAVAVFGWRAGTDVDDRGLVVRALLGNRRILWTQVDALVPRQRGVQAVLANGHSINLPGVTRSDLPKIAAINEPAEAEPGQAEPEPAQEAETEAQ